MKYYCCIFALLTFLISTCSQAQDITVINHYGDTTGRGDNVSYYLQNSRQHTLLINYYEPIAEEEIGRLERLIGNALSYYVDQMVVIAGDRVHLTKKKKIIIKELNQIVEDGIKFYNYQALKNFSGFSQAVVNQIEALANLDLSSIQSDADETESLKYFYVQSRLNDLKLLLNIEIGNFSNQNLFHVSAIDSGDLTADEQALILSELGNMDLHDPLDNIEGDLSPEVLQILSSLSEQEQGVSDGNFDLIFATVRENSKRLDDIQNQLNMLANVPTASIQKQIDDLQSAIHKILENGQIVSGSELVPNLPKKITLTYPQASSTLNLGQEFILNELVEVLARNPRLRVVITGYTDLTGTAYSNWNLSKQRATNVRNFLLNRGLDDNRMIMNYYGEKFAHSNSPDERKVEIEFFVY